MRSGGRAQLARTRSGPTRGNQRRIPRSGPMRKIDPAATTRAPARQASAIAAAGSAMAQRRREARCGGNLRRERRERLGGERARARRRRAHERRASREERRQHAADVLVAHHADDERHIGPPDLAEIVGQRARARRIVRRVEEHVGSAPPQPLEAAGPARIGQSRAHGRAVERHAQPETSSVIRQNATRGVVDLVAATQREPARPRAGVRRLRARPSSRHRRVVRPAMRRGRVRQRGPAARRARRQVASITARAPGATGPTTTGIPGLMTPAFSRAIDSRVSPRRSW